MRKKLKGLSKNKRVSLADVKVCQASGRMEEIDRNFFIKGIDKFFRLCYYNNVIRKEIEI